MHRGSGNQKERYEKEQSCSRQAGSDEQTNLRDNVGTECEQVNVSVRINSVLFHLTLIQKSFLLPFPTGLGFVNPILLFSGG